MDSLKLLDFSSFIIFSDDPWSLLVSFCQLFKLPLVVQCCNVICEWPLIKPRQRWTTQPTHSPQFQLSVPPGGGVCTSDINDMTPCLVADYIISLHTSHCLQHFSTADTAGALQQTCLHPARDTRGHLASGLPI